MNETAPGYCQCGCGEKTRIARKTRTNEGIFKGQPKRFLNGHNAGIRTGENNPGWKGGRKVDVNGYVLILLPNHPRANKNGYVLEHILVLEKALGRPILPGETGHHIDGNRANNSPGNLILFKTGGMHTSYHKRLRVFEASGHWDWRQCCYCHKHDDPANMMNHGSGSCHLVCRKKYRRGQASG